MAEFNASLRNESTTVRRSIQDMQYDHLNLRRRLSYATKGLHDLSEMLSHDTRAGRYVRKVLRDLEDSERCVIHAEL